MGVNSHYLLFFISKYEYLLAEILIFFKIVYKRL